jgi:hypothetical protein
MRARSAATSGRSDSTAIPPQRFFKCPSAFALNRRSAAHDGGMQTDFGASGGTPVRLVERRRRPIVAEQVTLFRRAASFPPKTHGENRARVPDPLRDNNPGVDRVLEHFRRSAKRPQETICGPLTEPALIDDVIGCMQALLKQKVVSVSLNLGPDRPVTHR